MPLRVNKRQFTHFHQPTDQFSRRPTKSASVSSQPMPTDETIYEAVIFPHLSREQSLSHSDTALVHNIFKKLKSTPMTLELLRYSRMEKALMVIIATGASCWPMEIVVMAEEVMQKWEDQMGPLKDLRADLYGPEGKLEGLKEITTWEYGTEERDDDAKSTWSIKGGVDPTRAHKHGHLGFEVGHWWLKPAAAFRDGIIDETAHAITADDHGVYAIVLKKAQAEDLAKEGHVKFHAAHDDPEAPKLRRLAISDTEKVVRVLRSWKLRSELAPKAGLRYDGLYRVTGFGHQPDHPGSDSWHITATLVRIADQPSIQQALSVPMADQLDDWKDYLRLKNMDRGKDFAFLREIVSSPITDLGEAAGVRDGGYFSRRGSKTNTEGAETPNKQGVDEDDGYFSRRGSRFKLSETATPTVKEEEEAENEGDPGYFSRQGSIVTSTSM